jgi:F420-0:gamma-glutamyl ligase
MGSFVHPRALDHSERAGPGTLVLLRSTQMRARAVRDRIAELAGVVVGVVVTDSFGRRSGGDD